jgi:hypothetical protein
MHHTAALFDVAVALTTQRIALADLTPEAFLHYIWQSRDQGLTMKARGKQNRGQFPGQLAWPVLYQMGCSPLPHRRQCARPCSRDGGRRKNSSTATPSSTREYGS